MDHPTTRVLAALELLQSRPLVSGADMAAALGVDRRSVRRYIALLEEMGIPIATERGRHGGYRVMPGFKLPPLMFSGDEAVALSVGLIAARGLGLGQSAPALASAQAKLERVLPEKLHKKLRAIDETVTLELSRPVAALSHETLGTLSDAARDRTRVRLAYRTPQGEDTVRDFDPYGLVYRGGRWYAVGHCHLRRDLRSFRLDRVQAVTAVGTPFKRPGDFDALEYLKRSVALLPRRHTVEVLLATDLLTAQREIFSAFGTLEWAPGGVLLRSQADDIDWFARQLSALPFDFTVGRPDALNKALATAGARLARLAKE